LQRLMSAACRGLRFVGVDRRGQRGIRGTIHLRIFLRIPGRQGLARPVICASGVDFLDFLRIGGDGRQTIEGRSPISDQGVHITDYRRAALRRRSRASPPRASSESVPGSGIVLYRTPILSLPHSAMARSGRPSLLRSAAMIP